MVVVHSHATELAFLDHVIQQICWKSEIATHNAVQVRHIPSNQMNFESTHVSILVDGGWGNWTSGNCSKPCGGGVLNVSRSCDNPVPSCGGRYCDGIEFEELLCNGELCESMQMFNMCTCIINIHIYHSSEIIRQEIFNFYR